MLLEIKVDGKCEINHVPVGQIKFKYPYQEAFIRGVYFDEHHDFDCLSCANHEVTIEDQERDFDKIADALNALSEAHPELSPEIDKIFRIIPC